jgi:hypothetical protein
MNQGFGAASNAPIPPPRLVVEEADSDPATSPSRHPKAARNSAVGGLVMGVALD